MHFHRHHRPEPVGPHHLVLEGTHVLQERNHLWRVCFRTGPQWFPSFKAASAAVHGHIHQEHTR